MEPNTAGRGRRGGTDAGREIRPAAGCLQEREQPEATAWQGGDGAPQQRGQYGRPPADAREEWWRGTDARRAIWLAGSGRDRRDRPSATPWRGCDEAP